MRCAARIKAGAAALRGTEGSRLRCVVCVFAHLRGATTSASCRRTRAPTAAGWLPAPRRRAGPPRRTPPARRRRSTGASRPAAVCRRPGRAGWQPGRPCTPCRAATAAGAPCSASPRTSPAAAARAHAEGRVRQWDGTPVRTRAAWRAGRGVPRCRRRAGCPRTAPAAPPRRSLRRGGARVSCRARAKARPLFPTTVRCQRRRPPPRAARAHRTCRSRGS
jgi:hypothetical protein